MKVFNVTNNSTIFIKKAILIDGDCIFFCKNNLIHREDGPACIDISDNLKKDWVYKGVIISDEYYGFTIKQWKSKVKHLKYEEKFGIFK